MGCQLAFPNIRTHSLEVTNTSLVFIDSSFNHGAIGSKGRNLLCYDGGDGFTHKEEEGFRVRAKPWKLDWYRSVVCLHTILGFGPLRQILKYFCVIGPY